ncbi:MAG TPA: hypothetical protein VN132_04045 [Bdellovibrio sp.]|nr:hypothetical protein [Bdellovibrio sp.]
MTKILTVACALLFPAFGFASVSVTCEGLAPFKNPIYFPGNDQLIQVKSLNIDFDQRGYMNVAMTAAVKTTEDQLNAEINNEKLEPKDVVEKFKVSSAPSGTLVGLEADKANTLNLGAVFVEIGQPNVEVEGPLPQGTYPVQTAFAFVTSKYSVKDPMNIQKLVLNCKMNVAY